MWRTAELNETYRLQSLIRRAGLRQPRHEQRAPHLCPSLGLSRDRIRPLPIVCLRPAVTDSSAAVCPPPVYAPCAYPAEAGNQADSSTSCRETRNRPPARADSRPFNGHGDHPCPSANAVVRSCPLSHFDVPVPLPNCYPAPATECACVREACSARRVARSRCYPSASQTDFWLGHVDVHFAPNLPEPLHPVS